MTIKTMMMLETTLQIEPVREWVSLQEQPAHEKRESKHRVNAVAGDKTIFFFWMSRDRTKILEEEHHCLLGRDAAVVVSV